MDPILIYGANGYTGALIAEEAVRRGLKPVLAGRNRDALDALAQKLSLTRRVFTLEDPAEIARHFDGIDLLLNCAGPFSQTAVPLLEACLEHSVHYLDITGEIDVFALCHRAQPRAQRQGIVVAPGVGFDVVPTDCAAAMLKQQLPDATHLVLAFEAAGGPSPGTAKTSVEGLAKGGRARVDGKVVDVPLAWKSRTFERDGQPRTAMTIPWGDVYTAFVSTGIGNVETYMVTSPKTIARVRRLRMLMPLLALAPVQSFLKSRAGATAGPDEQRRAATRSHVWGEVRNAAGDERRLQLVVSNGYALTVQSALGIAQHVLATRPAGDYYTPSQMMGAGYVLSLPGTSLIDG
ncbi:MAG: saccharopine dehydrogenase NADP-binding domain-containing protein [Dokdonella sp.]|uniref:saccharopine dehydrogenase family protein n=1 Tax=Dokdonella sp. TaxID=2291710 RepID=UPI00326353F8